VRHHHRDRAGGIDARHPRAAARHGGVVVPKRGEASATSLGAPPADAAALDAVPRPTRRQLWSLAIGNAVPFIGFGFADNLIMILAGDAIDKTLGAAFGISTLAAAGFGNMFSDVIGIGVGDVIERYSSAILGHRAVAALTLEQMELSVCRIVKTWASVVGISIGCLLGMTPLFFIGNRKPLYFTPEEMLLYESALRPYGVSPQNFFDLMRRAEWRSYEAGTTVLKAGQKLDRVLLVASGAVDSYETTPDGALKRLYRYRAKRDIAGADAAMPAKDRRSHPPIRGCVIGGTALLDESVRHKPYPSTVIAAEPTRVVEWSYSALRKEMDDDKSIEAAICSILYFDLVEGLRRQRNGGAPSTRAGAPVSSDKGAAGVGDEHDDHVQDAPRRLAIYDAVLEVALSDGVVHAAEREFLAGFALRHDITEAEHEAALARFGWTIKQWDAGCQEGRHSSGALYIKTAIPELLKQAGIKSRLVEKKALPKQPVDAPPEEATARTTTAQSSGSPRQE